MQVLFGNDIWFIGMFGIIRMVILFWYFLVQTSRVFFGSMVQTTLYNQKSMSLGILDKAVYLKPLLNDLSNNTL